GNFGRTIVVGDPSVARPAITDILAERGLTAAVELSVDGDSIILTPDLERITGDHVPQLIDTLAGLSSALRERDVPDPQLSGTLDATLQTLGHAIEERRGPAMVALAL